MLEAADHAPVHYGHGVATIWPRTPHEVPPKLVHLLDGPAVQFEYHEQVNRDSREDRVNQTQASIRSHQLAPPYLQSSSHLVQSRLDVSTGDFLEMRGWPKVLARELAKGHWKVEEQGAKINAIAGNWQEHALLHISF